jgi:hypothetical protein
MTPIESLQINGYCKLWNVYSKDEVAKTLEMIKSLDPGLPSPDDLTIPRLNRIARNIYNLESKDRWFTQMLFKSQAVEEILKYFLNDKYYAAIPDYLPNYILRSYSARSTGPTALPNHIDSFVPYPSDKEFLTMQVAIFLEDSTLDNGCTVVSPGSHLKGKYADGTEPMVAVEANAGDVIMWTGSLIHGTLANKTEKSRWSIIATFCRWWIKQAFQITEALPKEIYKDLSAKERAILGYSSVPALNERLYIDMKRGY